MSHDQKEPALPPGAAAAARTAEDSRHLVRASAIVTALGLVAKLMGLLREVASAAAFGATRAMDGFRVANDITQSFATWIEMPLRAAIIPYFTQIKQEVGEAEAWRRASNVINTAAAFLVALALVLFLGADALVRIFASGFGNTPGAWDESAQLVQLMVWSLVFSVLAVLLGSLQNLYRRQFFPAFGRVLNGLAVLLGVVLLGPVIGIKGLAIGILAGAILTFVLQLDIVWSYRRFYSFRVRPFAPEVRRVVALAFPLFVGLTGTRIDVLVDRNFASHLPEGHLAVLGYALIASTVVTDLVLMVSQAVLLPHFANLAAEKRYDEVRRRVGQAVSGFVFLMMPATALLVGAARPVVDLLYARGNFSLDAAALTAFVLPVMALAAPSYGVNQMLSQVFIADGDTKTPMVVGFWRLGFKVLLSLALFFWLGILGLAIATTASAFFRTALLWRWMKPELRPVGRPLVREVLQILVISALAAGAAWSAATGMVRIDAGDFGKLVAVLAAGVATVGVFAVLSFALRVPTLQVVLARVRRPKRG